MARQEISKDAWISVQADSIPCQREYDALRKARSAFNDAMIAAARKSKHLAANETLVIAHKAWGVSMAKVPLKATHKVSNGNVFASL